MSLWPMRIHFRSLKRPTTHQFLLLDPPALEAQPGDGQPAGVPEHGRGQRGIQQAVEDRGHRDADRRQAPPLYRNRMSIRKIDFTITEVLGQNAKKLIAHKMSVDAIPAGGGLA